MTVTVYSVREKANSKNYVATGRFSGNAYFSSDTGLNSSVYEGVEGMIPLDADWPGELRFKLEHLLALAKPYMSGSPALRNALRSVQSNIRLALEANDPEGITAMLQDVDLPPIAELIAIKDCMIRECEREAAKLGV